MKFSVLMSLYDKENPDFLTECFTSLVEQTLQADEIVLVLDGYIHSNLESVIERFQNILPLKIISLPSNVGLGQALNIGLTHCTYEWVLRMDTDDICVPNRFEKQVTFIKNYPNIDILGGQIIEFDKVILHGKKTRIVPYSHDEIVKYAKFRNPINHMTVAFKKSVVLAVGNYRHAPLYEDYDLWVRLLTNGKIFANLPEVLVYARAGQAMYERRGGVDYAKYEIAMQRNFYRQGFLSIIQVIKNLAIRLPVRLLPNSLRSYIYQTLLRK